MTTVPTTQQATTGSTAAQTTVQPSTTVATAPTTVTTQPSNEGSGFVTERSRELVEELNRWRAKEGLSPVAFSPDMASASERCSRSNLERIERGDGGLQHCGYEVLFAGPASWSAEQMLQAWWNSPGHLRALTHTTSTEAGGAVVYRTPTGQSVAAITIDY